jgi:hypothetical protein
MRPRKGGKASKSLAKAHRACLLLAKMTIITTSKQTVQIKDPLNINIFSI